MFRRLAKFLLLVIYGTATVTYGVTINKTKNIQITADEVTYNTHTQQTEYLGHVIAISGKTKLVGSRMTILQNNKQHVDSVIMYGDPAVYQGGANNNYTALQAHAQSIRYLLESKIIILTGNAYVQQNPNSLTSQQIIYDTVRRQALTQANAKQRTVINLGPQNLQPQHT